jgi:hypothetical protein
MSEDRGLDEAEKHGKKEGLSEEDVEGHRQQKREGVTEDDVEGHGRMKR